MKYTILLIITLFCATSFAASYKHDSSKQVEITSDMLEVFQDKSTATFSGNVIATQDRVSIHSNEMTVHYNMKKNISGKAQSSISKVEATGHVSLTTPTDKATGNKGVFDVNENVITLSGNVTLQSGKNMVKGEKFLYNLKTGKSRIISGGGAQDKDRGTKGRVRGTFIPNK